MQEELKLSQQIVADDLADHLLVLREEFSQTVKDMEEIRASTAAAAHYAAQRTCERFLTNHQAHNS
ncbi:hypothetical protein ACT3TB_16355 [Micrococcaceae sp. AOP34-BR2-30]